MSFHPPADLASPGSLGIKLDPWLHRLAHRMVDCDLHPREVTAIVGTSDLSVLAGAYSVDCKVRRRVRWLVELLDYTCILFGPARAATWLRESAGPSRLCVIERLVTTPHDLRAARSILGE